MENRSAFILSPDLQGAVVKDRVRVFFILVFVAAGVIGAFQKNLTQGFDEVPHISYIAYLQKTGVLWPRLEDLFLLDPASFQFTNLPSYLNHPPIYYQLISRLGPAVQGNPGSVVFLRLINVGLATIGCGALVFLGRSLRLSRLEEYVWIVSILSAPALLPLAGSVNNDNLAIAGGAVAVLASHRLLATGQAGWLVTALAAMIAAAFAKLTGLLLVGGLVAGVLATLVWRRAYRGWWLPVAMAAGLVAASPYLIFWAQYGTPTPDTPGQIGLLTDFDFADASAKGATAPLAFAAYVVYFAKTFIVEWMPVVAERNAFQYAMLAAPGLALLCAAAGAAVAAGRLRQGEPLATDILVVVGLAVVVSVAAIHVAFSYRHHVAYGIVDGRPTYSYRPDAYPRYYLPLGAIVPLACLALLAALRDTRLRNALASLLIVGAILFTLFGDPAA